ncbi:IQ calmodulin-binding motif domain protein [Metarhizium acridum CQMa 102]|uniref:IQ calmodulin-binding motif domain protein n=1 Tax=Metarhizium acridum (strain CQMa 102) TaxID=655827 RepID=E9DYT4_METAQ|nr:IQ calmodulin-binding motif domain protein [Metarhizium acridum CQMa 102]EFY91111.1 IQ calmodulin-binding motif domain protein [Metarhizium acridum CQMa 102]
MRRPSPDLTEPPRNLQESNGPTSDDATAMDLDLAMPPSDDDVLEHDNRIYTPPPRVAARFYRPSQARRRDSAASSRRNSISSAHSRCSSLQHGPSRNDNDQSKYVAQHLRRASFLEDRRARLADRAAHAEKVRHRAALAKAAPRGPTASEERALAAQQARERNLAEIVANCAEEVRKAKQVAELTKERREQEVAKMRAQMEERMAEAERRREELLNKSATKRARGQSVMARKASETLAQVKEDTKPRLSEDDAAACIQGWWRGRTRKRIIQEFNGLGLSVDGIRDTSFDTVVELLAQEKVLIVTARLLRICGLKEGAPGSVDEMAAVRTFLSAFLILGHPHQVLINKNEPESESQLDVLSSHRLPSTDLANPQLQDLVGKAKDLLVNFENIFVRLTASNRYTMPPALKSTLPEAYAVFYNAFIAWKSRDSNALIEVMLMQFVELDAIFQTVKDTTDDAAASLYRKSIQDSQLMLIVRIKKLAGAEKGKRLIFKAVSEARKSRKAKKQTGDTKPRVAEGSAGDVTATASSLVSSEAQTLTPPTTPSGKSESESKPVVVKTGLNGLLPDNRIVVHELAINKEYQIPSEEYVEQQAALARPLYMQMRAAMAENDAESNFRYFILMASNIKEKLQRLLRPGNSMYNLIGEILDPELAERQFVVGSFSYEKFFTAMGSLLPKLCAPFRDDEVKNVVQNKLSDGDLIDRVEALNSFIDVMLCDYINYLLRIAAPQLIDSASQYEAKRFTADVAKGGMNLNIAEAAWRSATTKVMDEVRKRDPEGVNHPKSKPGAARFYAQMLVDVFTQPTPVKMEQIPEMLQLDHRRINEVSCTIQRIITAGAVLLQCKNLLKRDVRSAWKTEATRIMTVLEANHSSLDATVQGTMAALEAGRSMPAVTKSHLRALVTKVLKASQEMSEQNTEPREPVLRLLLTRLRGNILARLAPGSASEKVKAANTAGEKLASLGLSEFVERVRGISDLLDKVGSVDRAAHGTWWDAVATKVQQEDMT